jgi:hypothetical protein
MSQKKIRIKAGKDAPDQVAHGNLLAEKKDGYYTTDNRRFADHIVASGYGKETAASKETSEKPAAKKATAARPAASRRTAKTASRAKTSAAVNKAGAEAAPVLPAETAAAADTKGGTE